MNHYLNNRPSFLTITDKQRIAHHRLHDGKTTRSEPEMGHCRRTLLPVPLGDVELPRLPLVRVPGDTVQYVALGEVAQMPGKVLLIDIVTGAINVSLMADQLELVSPADL